MKVKVAQVKSHTGSNVNGPVTRDIQKIKKDHEHTALQQDFQEIAPDAELFYNSYTLFLQSCNVFLLYISENSVMQCILCKGYYKLLLLL